MFTGTGRMCLVIAGEAKRSRVSEDVILLEREDFDRLKDSNYLKVLMARDKPEEISRSYHYYIMNRLKSLGLFFEGSYSFYAVVPFVRKEAGMALERAFLVITKTKKLLLYDEEAPGECSCDERCVDALNDLLDDLNLRVKRETPREVLQAVAQEIVQRISENGAFMRLPGEVLWTHRS